MKFFAAFFTCGCYLVGYVLAMEVIGGSLLRSIVGNVFWFPFSFGGMALALYAYYLPNVQHYTIAIVAPSAVLLVMFL